MPNRIIKESICTSDTVEELTWFEEVFFYRLIVNCDDYGRTDARLPILKSRLFPLKSVTEKQIGEALNKLATVGIVQVYEHDQKPYLQFLTWDKHQTIRNKKSKYPSFEDAKNECKKSHKKAIESNCNQLQSNVTVIQSNPIQYESESESECKHEDTDVPSVPTVASIILNDKSYYIVTDDDVKHWEELYPNVDIVQELKKMQGWSEANPNKRKTKKGISRFIVNWLAREQDKNKAQYDKPKQPKTTKFSNFEQRETSYQDIEDDYFDRIKEMTSGS